MGKSNKNREKLLMAIGIMGLILFCIIAYIVSAGYVTTFDDNIRFWTYDKRNDFLNKILIFITYCGNWQTVTSVVVIMILIKNTRKNIGIPLAVTAINSTLIYKVIKHIFERPRPDIMYRIIEQGGFSFPSGHSMNSLVCYGILIYLIRKNCKNNNLKNLLTILLVILIPLIAISRVYVGVHFPTDIIGGWCLGIFVLMFAILIIERIGGKNDLQKH